MDDHKVLEHLLSLEAEAASLVESAQAEADRKIAEAEKQHRAAYDEACAGESTAQETSYIQNVAAVKEDYRKQLDAYREDLKTQPVNTKAFSSLAEKLLLVKEA